MWKAHFKYKTEPFVSVCAIVNTLYNCDLGKTQSKL